MNQQSNLKEAIFGGGCFWCTEAIFQDLKGVEKVESGYSGGHVEHPTYEQVCTKTTGHAEVIKISYDSSIISYAKLLEIFFLTHDPTTPNQQGNDKGPQYRSVIYYQDEAEMQAAESGLKAIEEAAVWPNKIVTEIGPLINYYAADDYHQNYYKRTGNNNPYCTYVVGPKVAKFKQKFADLLN